MSSVLTPSAVNHITYTLPSDGDTRNAASVNVPFQQLAESIAYLQQIGSQLVQVSPFRPTYTARTPTGLYCPAWSLTQPIYPQDAQAQTGGSPEVKSSILGIYQEQEVVTASTTTWLKLMLLGPNELRNGRTLSTVELQIDPNSGHGALPAGMPAITVIRALWDGSASPQHLYSGGTNGWQVDTSGTVGAFEVSHKITLTCNQFNVVDHTQYVYALGWCNECGTNAVANGSVFGVRFTMT